MSVLSKNQEAQSSASKPDTGISLDDLQTEAEKLLALLKDRQTGISVWHMFLHERLENLHKLTSQALGK